MGTVFSQMHALHGRCPEEEHGPKEVEGLATKALSPLLNGHACSHLVAATSCPDALAPSLAQCLVQRFPDQLGEASCFDLVQGCTGGVSALILASQLAEQNRSSVLVVTADAAQKATSRESALHSIFSNGAFACTVSYAAGTTGLLHFRSRQYRDLAEVVTIRLGHDADAIIRNRHSDMLTDPRKHLGLHMNSVLALRLMKQAERFYLDFIREGPVPDILLLHQVNPVIMAHLASVFSSYAPEFINLAEETGNCGASTTGVVLHKIRDRIAGKKLMICSFGTGGVITAGLWKC